MDKDSYKNWLNYYKKAHAIKNPVEYEYDRNKKKHRLPMDEGVFEDFISDINYVLVQSGKYLDSVGFHITKPLWKYKISDPTTWPSSPDFAFSHLL